MSHIIKKSVRFTFVAVMAAAIAGCSLIPREESGLNPPLVKPAQENYRTVKVERGIITKQISGVGVIESVATDNAQFTGEGGRIDRMEVSSGDMVKKGDVLVSLNMNGLDLQLKEQELALESAKYAHRQIKNGDVDVERLARLRMEIEQIKYNRLLTQFNTKQIRSNIEGQIIFVEDLKQGDWVEPFQTLVIVADPTKLRVSLRVDNSSEIQIVDVGMNADLSLNENEMTGKVVQTPSSAPQSLNKELTERYARTLYINVPEFPEEAEMGTFVDVMIVTVQKENVLIIPRSGLRAYLGRSFVRVLEEGNRVREIDVEQGIVTSTSVEIMNGLEEGEEIILL